MEVIRSIECNYDLILFDCAPTESFLTTAAYLASDFLVVPVKPEYLSAIGLPLLARSLAEHKRQYSASVLALAGIVFNNTQDYLPEEVKSQQEVREVAKVHGWYVFESKVPFSRSFPKGAREGRPIWDTSHARSFRTSQFRKVAEEFAKQVSL